MPLIPSSTKDSIKKHGDPLTDPMLLEGATMSYDGYGLRILNCSYKVVDSEKAPDFTAGGQKRVGDEIIAGSQLFVSKITKRYNRDLTVTIDYEAVGLEPWCSFQTAPCCEGAGTTSGEPIETHPDFESKIGGTKAAPKNGATFDEKKKFTGFAIGDSSTVTSKAPLAGVRTYLSPRNIVRGYFHANNYKQPSTLFQYVGKKTNLSFIGDFIVLPSEYLSAAAGAGFLITAINIENICVSDGTPKISKVSFELMQGASPNGWNDLIYTDAT